MRDILSILYCFNSKKNRYKGVCIGSFYSNRILIVSLGVTYSIHIMYYSIIPANFASWEIDSLETFFPQKSNNSFLSPVKISVGSYF